MDSKFDDVLKQVQENRERSLASIAELQQIIAKATAMLSAQQRDLASFEAQVALLTGTQPVLTGEPHERLYGLLASQPGKHFTAAEIERAIGPAKVRLLVVRANERLKPGQQPIQYEGANKNRTYFVQ